jgi:DNA-directed RNA polymerase specialized sigma24 family protein
VWLAIPEDREQVAIDECLWPYLKSRDQSSTQAALDQLLIEVAKPLTEQIIQRLVLESRTNKFKASRTEVAETATRVLLKLLQRLKAFKADPQSHPISNFRGMIATTAYHTFTDRWREQDRQRANQERKLRRLVAANRSLAIWKNADGKLVCGYEVWKTQKSDSQSGVFVDVPTLTKELEAFRQDRDAAELLMFALNRIAAPIKFGDLVSAIFTPGAIEPETLEIVPIEASDIQAINALADPVATFERQVLLAQLFEEISKLSSIQRQALLLNMTDSYGFSIEWFVFAGVATEAQLAELLEVSIDEFAALLDRVPLTDKEIATRLRLDSVNVGNIRKAVRDRLKRRRQAFVRGD